MTADLDRYWPPRGPCGLCGHPDARHREWDTIWSRYQAGETGGHRAVTERAAPYAERCLRLLVVLAIAYLSGRAFVPVILEILP